MSNDTTRWRPDPSGVHELRFFSSDGKPTRLVMDGGRTSYDQTSSSASAPPAAASASMGSELPPSLRTPPSRPAPPPHCEPEALERATHSDDDRPQSVVDVPLGNTEREDSPWRGPRRIAYGIVLVVLALSALGLILVQLNHRREPGRAQALASTTTTTAAPESTTTTVAIPTALRPDAESAATALVSSWATGNRAAALTVATPAAVATLFAVPYPSGLAEDRGCSTTFQPIVCTFGPPGGANPNDPIYEIDVSQAPGGWYVSAAKV